MNNPKIKTLNTPFTMEEYLRLNEAKGDMTWHDFIMTLAKEEE
jgi:hypothetical protein